MFTGTASIDQTVRVVRNDHGLGTPEHFERLWLGLAVAALFIACVLGTLELWQMVLEPMLVEGLGLLAAPSLRRF